MTRILFGLSLGFGIFEFEAYEKGVYFLSTGILVSSLLAFIVGVLGFQLLWEKMAVPSVVLILSYLIGSFLGLDVKPLGGSDLVIAGSLITTGFFVALNIEMTLVGFAVMAIVFGFFQGHAYGVTIPDSDNAPLYIIISTVIMGLASFFGVLAQRFIPKTSYLQMIGIVVCMVGILLLVFE